MELRIYGLPGDTDIDALAHKALDTAAMLEEMGIFDQREHEPAHIFFLSGKDDKRIRYKLKILASFNFISGTPPALIRVSNRRWQEHETNLNQEEEF